MSKPILMVGPDHTLRRVAQLMSARRVGSAVMVDPESAGVGIMTERDLLNAIGAGLDPAARPLRRLILPTSAGTSTPMSRTRYAGAPCVPTTSHG